MEAARITAPSPESFRLPTWPAVVLGRRRRPILGASKDVFAIIRPKPDRLYLQIVPGSNKRTVLLLARMRMECVIAVTPPRARTPVEARCR